MQIRLITVGQKMPSWVEQGYDEYARRFPRDFQLELIEVPAVKRGKNADIARLTDKEGEAMLSHVSSGDWVIALDVKGK